MIQGFIVVYFWRSQQSQVQVKDLFGEIEGMVSWRLSMQKDGVSRGFGFAEFKTPEGTA